MARRRIGILTGGGDVPGLNAVIKSVVYSGDEHGVDVLGIRRGWEGLTNLDLGDRASREHCLIPLTRENTRTVDRTGGTMLHSSRVNPATMKKLPPEVPEQEALKHEKTEGGVTTATWDVTPHVLRNLDSLGLEHLIAIGGDDTLSYAAHLGRQGAKVMGIPKTMDNDVRNTEYCIGFSTALTRAVAAIERQRTTIGSHERIGVFRIFGRDAGFTALYTAYVTSVRCIIPEYKPRLEHVIEMLLADKKLNPSNYSLIVLSEGAEWEGYEVQEYGEPDAYGHRKKLSVGESFSEEIKHRTGEETLVSDLTYDLRSGEPDFFDKLVALTFGSLALEAVLEGKSGLMPALVNGQYDLVPIPDPELGPRRVDVSSMYNTDRCRPIYDNKRGLPVFLDRL